MMNTEHSQSLGLVLHVRLPIELTLKGTFLFEVVM